ncbi:hypothetical protein PtB15_14B240 [Puccinia triticina]|nr:hypothetical protein PtB15_14B240 [Puccinia triticina]
MYGSQPVSDLVGVRPSNPEPHPRPPATHKSGRKRKKQQVPILPPPAKNHSSGTQSQSIRNLPGADGQHHPLLGAAVASTIDILEEVANQNSSQDHPLSTTSSHPNSQLTSTQPRPSDHLAPLEGLHEALNSIAPKKNRKRLRTWEEDGRVLDPEPMSDKEVLSHTVANLVAFARENSKGAMSEADRAFFSNYVKEQRKMLVSKAIEREVSMEMVDKFLGKHKAVQRPNRWNHFLQRLSACNKFRGVGKGVGGHRLGMSQISLLYKRHNARKKLAQTVNCPDSDPASRSPSPEPKLTPSELALDDDLYAEAGLDPETTPPPASELCGSVSLLKAANQVEKFLANWANQVCYHRALAEPHNSANHK